MDYKLAKELKENGFPQEVGKDMPSCRGGYITGDNSEFDVGKIASALYIPTLEELIEACGDGFRSLTWHYTMKEWVVIGIPEETRGKVAKEWKGKKHNTVGKTPSEAVARLYLSLNKKVVFTR